MDRKPIKGVLGRGLAALVSTPVPVAPARPIEQAGASFNPNSAPTPQTLNVAPAEPRTNLVPFPSTSEGEVQYLSPTVMSPSKFQPRTEFIDTELKELSESIRTLGVIQPILVRRSRDDATRFEIIAGERRWRAAQLAQLTAVPVIIRALSDRDALEIALVENVQRSNLNPVEEGKAYQRLCEEFGLSQQEVADRVGKDRASVANCVRLLKLPEEVLNLLREGKLTPGHAKALLTVKEPAVQINLARKIVAQSMSVREIEAIVSRTITLPKKKRSRGEGIDGAHQEVIEKLREKLGTKVALLDTGKGRGRLVIEYFSEEELARVTDAILGV